MKIIFIGHSGYNYSHVRVRCYNFSSALKKMGMDTEVFSYKDHLLSPQYDEEVMYALSDKRKIQLSVKALFKLFSEKDNIFYIQKLLFHSAVPFFLSRMGRNRYILDCDDWDGTHGVLFKTQALNRLFFGMQGKTDKYGNINDADYERILLHYAKSALCCIASSHLLKEILSSVNEKTYYLPTGVDILKFNNNSNKKDDGTITFCWTGVVWGDVIFDNILFLLHCFSTLKKKYGNIRLKILGGGQYMHRVKEIISMIYSNDEIEILNPVPPDDVPKFLSSVDVGVVPLIQKNDRWINSKSPTKLFEFMACGMPVVASRCGENRYVINDGKDGFLASGKDEFIKKMEILITDNRLRKEMGENAVRTISEKYSLNILGEKLYGMINEIQV